MGLITTQITLSNVRRADLKPVVVEAMADTGSVYLCISPTVAEELKLDDFGRREVTLADGTKHQVRYVGPLLVQWKDRSSLGGALVMGETILLGAIQMEDMDLVLSPFTRTISVNPTSPSIPSGVAMSSIC